VRARYHLYRSLADKPISEGQGCATELALAYIVPSPTVLRATIYKVAKRALISQIKVSLRELIHISQSKLLCLFNPFIGVPTEWLP
jgi:hypothetical protein